MSALPHMLAMVLMSILKKECIDNVPGEAGVKNSTKADVVTLRKHTGNDRIVLTVQHFHPLEQKAWSDEVVGSRDAIPVDGLKFPNAELGGQRFNRKKMSIELSFNLTRTREDAIEADAVIQEVITRTKWAIEHNKKELTGLTDDYHNTSLEVVAVGDAEYDSGAGEANVTRCWVKISIMIHSNPRTEKET